MELLFWNEDTQRDFMYQDGRLPIPNADEITPNLRSLTQYAKRNGIYVVNTGDWHDENSSEISRNPDYVRTFPMHCEIGTFGVKFIPETQPENPYVVTWKDKKFDKDQVLAARNLVLYKDNFCIFKGNPHTQKVLKVLAPEKIVLYGVATEVCDLAAVLGLRERNYPVYVVTDSIKEITEQGKVKALEQMAEAGARFVSTKEVLEGRLK